MKNKLGLNHPAKAISLLAFLAANLTLNIDVAHARFGGGGFGGFHGGGFGGFNQGGFGGDFRGGSIFHSDGDFNRPTFDQSTGQNAFGDRSWGNLPQNTANFGQSFDQNRTDFQQNRINTVNDLQKNSQNYWNSKNWNNGYYYPGWGCCYNNGWGWGAAGLTTGLLLGATINSLPSGYATIPVGSNNYYYYNGSYYLPSDSGYQVVAPPVNAVISTLPSGYTKVYGYGSNTPYYYYNGAFYNNNNGKYIIVQPPAGVMVPYLPQGYTTAVINGTTYYQYGSVTYQPYYSGGQVVYIVANPE